MAEGFWDDAVKATEKASKERAGKPFEKNPASHDKNGVYRGDKDMAGNPAQSVKSEALKNRLQSQWTQPKSNKHRC